MFGVKIVPESVGYLQHDQICPANDIEYIGKVCTAKEPSNDDITAVKFMTKLAKLGHEAVLEHIRIVVTFNVVDFNLCYSDLYSYLLLLTKTSINGRYLDVVNTDPSNDTITIEGNLHAWRDMWRFWDVLMRAGCSARSYKQVSDGMLGGPSFEDRLILFKILKAWHETSGVCVGLWEGIEDITSPLLNYLGDNLSTAGIAIALANPNSYHTIIMETARGITDEFVRHRVGQNMESTRWCRYKNGVRVVSPGRHFGWDKGGFRNLLKRCIWGISMVCTSVAYSALLALKCSAQEARSVLTLSTCAKLAMTATNEEWLKIMSLRLDANAHPQARYIASLICDRLVPHIVQSDDPRWQEKIKLANTVKEPYYV